MKSHLASSTIDTILRVLCQLTLTIAVLIAVAVAVAGAALADDDDDDDDDDDEDDTTNSQISNWPPTDLAWPPDIKPIHVGSDDKSDATPIVMPDRNSVVLPPPPAGTTVPIVPVLVEPGR